MKGKQSGKKAKESKRGRPDLQFKGIEVGRRRLKTGGFVTSLYPSQSPVAVASLTFGFQSYLRFPVLPSVSSRQLPVAFGESESESESEGFAKQKDFLIKA